MSEELKKRDSAVVILFPDQVAEGIKGCYSAQHSKWNIHPLIASLSLSFLSLSLCLYFLKLFILLHCIFCHSDNFVSLPLTQSCEI